jgi:hypothetical protein
VDRGPVQLPGGGLAGVADPAVLQALVRREALRRVDDEQVRHQVLGVGRHIVPVGRVEGEIGPPDLPDEGRVGLVVKRGEAGEHGVEDDAQRPQVHLGAVARRVIQVRVQHLRRRGPGSGRQRDRRDARGAPRLQARTCSMWLDAARALIHS